MAWISRQHIVYQHIHAQQQVLCGVEHLCRGNQHPGVCSRHVGTFGGPLLRQAGEGAERGRPEGLKEIKEQMREIKEHP